MANNFYVRLAAVMRWLQVPALIQTRHLWEQLERLRLSVGVTEFVALPGSDELVMLSYSLDRLQQRPLTAFERKRAQKVLQQVYNRRSLVAGTPANFEEAVMSTTTPSVPRKLVVSDDRCDRCGAAAQTRVVTADGHELLFCGHHTRKHEPAISQLVRESGARVYDQAGAEVVLAAA